MSFRKSRLLLGLCSFLIGGCLLILILLPTMFTISWIREKALDKINSQIPGTVTLDTVSLSWFGEQTIEGLMLYDSKGNPVVSIESLTTNTPLYNFLFSRNLQGDILVNSLNANIAPSSSGRTNLEESLGISGPIIQLQDSYSLRIIDLELELVNDQVLGMLLKASGSTLYGNMSGNIEVNIQGSNGKVNLSNIPSALLDTICASVKPEFEGLASVLFGEAVTLKLNKERQDQLVLHLQSPRLTAELSQSHHGKDNVMLDVQGQYHYGTRLPIDLQIHSRLRLSNNPDRIIANLVQPKELEVVIENFPTRFLDRFMDTGDRLTKAFGDSVACRMKSSMDDPRTLQLSFLSGHLKAPSITLTLDHDILLSEQMVPSSGTVFIQQIIWSNGDTVENVNIPWEYDHSGHQLHMLFSGNGKGSFKGELHLPTLQDSKNPSLQLSMIGHQIPTSLLELFTGRMEWSPLFGKTIDIQANANIKNNFGPLSLNLSGPKGSLHLDSTISNKVMKLNQPFLIETTPSSELGKKVLSTYASVFEELLGGENSLKLTISPEGFSALFNGDSWEDLQLSLGTLEMGKLVFKNHGDVRKLTNTLRPVRSHEISVWTTPLYFSIENGILTAHRMDFLIMDRYHAATWGRINLSEETMNMVIGLTGRTLATAFGIDNEGDEIVVQIPIQGKIEDARINSKKLTTQIASWIAQQNGSPEGFILGTVLNLANGKKGKVPPPTTQPFPWGSTISEQKKHIKENEISNFIKGLLK